MGERRTRRSVVLRERTSLQRSTARRILALAAPTRSRGSSRRNPESLRSTTRSQMMAVCRSAQRFSLSYSSSTHAMSWFQSRETTLRHGSVSGTLGSAERPRAAGEGSLDAQTDASQWVPTLAFRSVPGRYRAGSDFAAVSTEPPIGFEPTTYGLRNPRCTQCFQEVRAHVDQACPLERIQGLIKELEELVSRCHKRSQRRTRQ